MTIDFILGVLVGCGLGLAVGSLAFTHHTYLDRQKMGVEILNGVLGGDWYYDTKAGEFKDSLTDRTHENDY